MSFGCCRWKNSCSHSCSEEKSCRRLRLGSSRGLCCFRLMAVLSAQRSLLDFRGQRLLLEEESDFQIHMRTPRRQAHNTDKSAVSSGESSGTQKKRFFARFSPSVEAVLFTGLAALRAVFGCPFRPDSALTRAAPVVYDGFRSCFADTICSMGRRKHPQLMPNERLVINCFSNGK